MKKYIFILLVLFSFSCKDNNQNTDNTNLSADITSIEFENTVFDFGSIVEGETVTYVFNFTNTGDAPLVINNVRSSCGCTVPAYSKEPLNPGEDGFIKVTFNSSGKQGSQYKIVTVTTNTDPTDTELVVKGEVNTPNN